RSSSGVSSPPVATTRSWSWPTRRLCWPASSGSSTRITGDPQRADLDEITHRTNRADDGAAAHRPQRTPEAGYPYPGDQGARPVLRSPVRGSGGAGSRPRERAGDAAQAIAGDEARGAPSRALHRREEGEPEEARGASRVGSEA